MQCTRSSVATLLMFFSSVKAFPHMFKLCGNILIMRYAADRTGAMIIVARCVLGHIEWYSSKSSLTHHRQQTWHLCRSSLFYLFSFLCRSSSPLQNNHLGSVYRSSPAWICTSVWKRYPYDLVVQQVGLAIQHDNMNMLETSGTASTH